MRWARHGGDNKGIQQYHNNNNNNNDDYNDNKEEIKEVVWCFMYIKATTLTENYKVAYELWGERENVTRGQKKYLETIPGKHSIDCIRNIIHYKESATIRNLKPEWWGSPPVQEEKYQEKPVKRE
jgi:hypothetical protein